MGRLVKCKTCGKEFVNSQEHRKYCSFDCSPCHRKRTRYAAHVCYCIVCGAEIRTYPSKEKRFCSVECRKIHKIQQRHLKICEYCGKQYTVIPSDSAASHYCSNKCYHAGKRKYPIKLITCKNCGKEFSANFSPVQNSYPVFCSFECRVKYGWVTKTCEYCGVEFEVTRSRVAKRKYCSRECSNLAHRRRLIFNCDYCGKEVERSPGNYHSHNVQHHFCSLDCAHKYIDGDGQKWFAINCEYCGKEIQREKWRIERCKHRFCSKECHDKWQVGPNAYNWQGGIENAPYDTDFNEETKARIRERDDWTCQICKERMYEICDLPIHHINYIKVDSQDSNLIALCRSCHTKTNFNRDEWQALLTDHMRERGFA